MGISVAVLVGMVVDVAVGGTGVSVGGFGVFVEVGSAVAASSNTTCCGSSTVLRESPCAISHGTAVAQTRLASKLSISTHRRSAAFIPRSLKSFIATFHPSFHPTTRLTGSACSVPYHRKSVARPANRKPTLQTRPHSRARPARSLV